MPRYFPLPPRVVEVEVPIGDGDRDVSYDESIDISEELSGTLGPVNTDDSADVADTFVADDLTLQESLAAADLLQALEGLVAADSIDIAEALSGTLGPVQAQDSIDATDDPVIGPLTVNDSGDVSDAPQAPDLAATAQDSIDIQAVIGQITQLKDDSSRALDAFGPADGVVAESINQSDAFGAVSGLQAGDSASVSVVSDASLDANAPDSIAQGDSLGAIDLHSPDSHVASDARQDASVSTARLWPNTVVSNSGWANPGGWADTNISSVATLTANQSGGLLGGSSQTTNGDLIVDCGNVTFTPAATVSSAAVQYQYSTSAGGLLQTGNAVNVNLQYSLNNGGSWTTLVNINSDGLNPGAQSTAISVSSAQLNQIRFRAVGSVTSGTIAIVGGASQSCSINYIRLQFDAVQSL